MLENHRYHARAFPLLARRVAPVTAAAVVGFAIWTHVTASTTFFLTRWNCSPCSLSRRLLAGHEHRDGFAFAATTVTMAACIASIFAGLYPNVMVSSTNPAYNLTVHNTASGAYSLKAMTVVVIIFLPLVLAYQTWTYYVFRRRVTGRNSSHQPPACRGGSPGSPALSSPAPRSPGRPPALTG